MAPKVFTYDKPGQPNLSQVKKTKSVNFHQQVVLEDLEYCHNIQALPNDTMEYDSNLAGVAARFIYDCYLQCNGGHGESLSSLAQQ